jgi:4-alpha-glucanotransferase
VARPGLIIEAPYRDWQGEWHMPPPETIAAVQAVVGDEAVHPTTIGSRCVVPAAQQRAISVQVYSLWSDTRPGAGDLGHVADLARGLDTDLLMLSPLHARRHGETSPYFPSSRHFRDPAYLRTSGSLEHAWEQFTGDTRFDAYRSAQGAELSMFATFCALSEKFGQPWQDWPADVRHPDGREVPTFAVAHADRIRFHEWVQWRLDEQVAALARLGPGLVNDVAVGFDPAGADAWLWQDVVAPRMHVGAPPDAFNQDGQDWGAPPFIPAKLACAGYRPFVAALECAFAHAAGVRVDHVMGLFRLYWIPEGASPRDGVYVHYPAGPMLDLLAAESQRTGAFVVGEDLGTVDASTRAELARRAVLSYKVLWFEDRPPAEWPRESLAAVTTHDLPTVAGVWTGADGSPEMRARLETIAGDADLAVKEVVDRVHAALDGAPAAIVSHTLEDLLGETERPNHPGTRSADNWTRRLSLPVDAIVRRLSA